MPIDPNHTDFHNVEKQMYINLLSSGYGEYDEDIIKSIYNTQKYVDITSEDEYHIRKSLCISFMSPIFSIEIALKSVGSVTNFDKRFINIVIDAYASTKGELSVDDMTVIINYLLNNVHIDDDKSMMIGIIELYLKKNTNESNAYYNIYKFWLNINCTKIASSCTDIQYIYYMIEQIINKTISQSQHISEHVEYDEFKKCIHAMDKLFDNIVDYFSEK